MTWHGPEMIVFTYHRALLFDKLRPHGPEIQTEIRFKEKGCLTMRFRFWLTETIQSLKFPTTHSIRRHRSRSISPSVAIEHLEPRQLLTATAVKIGVETPVNSSTSGDQQHTAVAMDASGDYVVAWLSIQNTANPYQIYAQRYNATGTAQGGNILVGDGAYGAYPSVAMDAQGDFVIAWNIRYGGNPAGYAQRYNSSGATVGGRFQFSDLTTPAADAGIASPSVAMDSAGDFVISWFSYYGGRPTSGTDAVWAQRYNSSGVAQGSNFKVSNVTDSFNPTAFVRTPIPVSAAMDGAGVFVIAYSDNDTQGEVIVKRYNAAGILQGTVPVTSSTTINQQLRGVAIDTAGDFVVTWQSYRQFGGLQNGIYAQKFHAAGTAQGANIQLYQANTFTGVPSNSGVAGYIEASVAMDSAGDFTVTWTNEPDGNSTGIFEKSFTAAGVAEGSSATVNTYTTGIQAAPAIGMDAAGDFIVAWASKNQASSNSGWDVYSQQFYTAATPLLLQIEGTTLSAIGPQFTAITSTLNVHDGVYASWTGATVKITTNYQMGQDVLAFTNTAKITGSWNAGTGTLTLSGTDTLSNYRAALRSVTYHNTSASPNTALTRTVTFQTTNGHSSSDIVSRSLTVRATGTPPTLTGISSNGYFVMKTTPLALAANVVVTDPESLNILGATVSFTNWQTGDVLTFSNSFALQHTFTQDLTAHTATLTLTGSSSAANYQSTLRTLMYSNTAAVPNATATRIATITIHDALNSASQMEKVNVYTYLSGVSSSISFAKGSSPLAITPNLVLKAPQGVGSIVSATISFTNWQAEDRLAFYNFLGLQHTFTQDLNAHTATLTITGSADVAAYQSLLRGVTYQDIAGKPNTSAVRTATITVNDGTNTGSAKESVTVTA